MKRANYKKYLIAAFFLCANSILYAEDNDELSLIAKVNEFHTVNKDIDMKMTWDLKGNILEKYSDNSSKISRPYLTLFDDNVKTNISAKFAVDPTSDMKEIYLRENVIIIRKEINETRPLKIYTSRAIMHIDKDIIETDQNVTIKTADSNTSGIGLLANVNEGIITILSQAERTVTENGKTRKIKGNQMIYNMNTKKWTVKNKSALVLKDDIKRRVTTIFKTK